MIESLPSAPHDATNCNILIHGDLLYVCTANGVHRLFGEPTPTPDAPSLIALDKQSGRLVAADGEKIGRRTFHGQWSSPSIGKVGGRWLVFFGGGDGVLYAFEAATPAAGADKPAVLKKAWSYDCNPPDYRFDDEGEPIDYWAGDASRASVPAGWKGPSEIIATPVFHDGRVYVAIGRDPLHGVAPGALHCVEASGTGDVTRSGRVWVYRGIARSMSTVAVANGLVFAADLAGVVHCLDARTGEVRWTHETKQPIWTSPLAADGKVYVGTERGRLWVFAAGAEKRVLAKTRLAHKISATPAPANGVLYVASHRYLYAVTGCGACGRAASQ
jgi:hypothetical protein